MNLLNPDARLENFKKKIQFEEALSKEATSPLVKAINLEPSKYPELQGWSLNKKTNQTRGSELFYEWVFKKDKESLLIQAYLSPNNTAESRLRFLNSADSTSTMEIPFDKGPQDIGTLSAIPLTPPYDYVFFIYKNTYVHVRSYDSKVNALEISKGIYKQLIQN